MRTLLEAMSQLDMLSSEIVVAAEIEVAAETVVAAAEIAVEVGIGVGDFSESQRMQVYDNKLRTFQVPGSCMAQVVLSAFSAEL